MPPEVSPPLSQSPPVPGSARLSGSARLAEGVAAFSSAIPGGLQVWGPGDSAGAELERAVGTERRDDGGGGTGVRGGAGGRAAAHA